MKYAQYQYKHNPRDIEYTHTHTHTRTHARTHARTHEYGEMILGER